MLPCDCSTQWLKELEVSGSSITTATQPCESPDHLLGLSWDTLTPEDFGTDCTGIKCF